MHAIALLNAGVAGDEQAFRASNVGIGIIVLFLNIKTVQAIVALKCADHNRLDRDLFADQGAGFADALNRADQSGRLAALGNRWRWLITAGALVLIERAETGDIGRGPGEIFRERAGSGQLQGKADRRTAVFGNADIETAQALCRSIAGGEHAFVT